MSIEEHPLARRLPKPTGGPSIQPLSADLQLLAVRSDLPVTVDDMLGQDVPLLSLHVTVFSDATLVGFTWPHVLMDAMGAQAVLRGWSLVLAGRQAEVPPLLGARHDVLLQAEHRSAEMGQQEPLMLEPRRLGAIGCAIFFTRLWWCKFWQPAVETRTVHIPRRVYARLHSRVQQDAGNCFISEGDVLAAWLAAMAASSGPRPRPMTICTVFNLRSRLPLLQAKTGVYVQNLVLGAFFFLSPLLARGPLGPIALAHRRHLAAQATEQQSLALSRLLRQDIELGRSPRLLFGEALSSPMLVNNLAMTRLFCTVDFGAAVLRQGEATELRRNRLGTMVYYLPFYQHRDSYAWPVAKVVVLGKDQAGSYWLSCDLQPRTWARVEEELRSM